MDCISVFAAGVTPVLATSGTAFTEQQARLLRRYTTRRGSELRPGTAGANAAEKSIALLTEEGFEVRVVTLEGGLDPDRFVRERGIQAYAEALKGAVRHSDYLIERARQDVPGADGSGQGGGGELFAAAYPADAARDCAGRVCAGRGAEAGYRLRTAATGTEAGCGKAAGAGFSDKNVEFVRMRARAGAGRCGNAGRRDISQGGGAR